MNRFDEGSSEQGNGDARSHRDQTDRLGSQGYVAPLLELLNTFAKRVPLTDLSSTQALALSFGVLLTAVALMITATGTVGTIGILLVYFGLMTFLFALSGRSGRKRRKRGS